MLNPQSPIPLYRQLADALMASIKAGEYPPGSRIASEHQLAAAHGIGRPTARQAIDWLVRKGMVVRRRGAGTFVCEPRQEVDLFSLDGTSASFQKKGLAVHTRLLQPAQLLDVDQAGPDNPFSGRQAYFLSRLTLVDQSPILLEDLYLRPELFAGLDQLDLQGRSLSAIAEEQYYLKPTGGRQLFSIGYVHGERARQLQIAKDLPILMVKRFLHFPHTADGVFCELWCRTDQFVFSQSIGGTAYA